MFEDPRGTCQENRTCWEEGREPGEIFEVPLCPAKAPDSPPPFSQAQSWGTSSLPPANKKQKQ